MSEKSKRWLYICPVIYLAAALCGASFGWLSFALLLLMAAGLYLFFYSRTSSLINLPGLLGLFWFGGEAIACLKLSYLSANWEWMTWLSFFLFYASFLLAYLFWEKRGQRKQREACQRKRMDPALMRRYVFLAICIMAGVSFAAFLVEALRMGYVPALVLGVPHAYSEFHVTGVHYFTVSSVMVHPLSVIYLYYSEKGDPKRKWLILLNLIAIAVPFLCVSRFFMIMSVALTVIVFLALKGNVTRKTLIRLGIGCVVFLIPVCLILTVFRSHSVSYLNTIFEMKNPNTPIFVAQPYIYIANNYENFNCLVRDVGTDFMLGRRQLFPVFALTGLKFVLPSWMVSTSPDFITKTELTTVTILYDAYYDFGIIGVIGFGALLGLACASLTQWVRRNQNPVAWLFYGQIAMYLILSFFTTWFSNPTTWFWLVLTGIIYCFVQNGGAYEGSNSGRRFWHKNQ